MRSIRPLTVSLPLGLFSSATMSMPMNPLEMSSTRVPLDRALLDMPNVVPETDGLEDDIDWDDGSN
jgi:hypothetical protein